MHGTVNKNYKIRFAFGNCTSHAKYSKRVVEITVNDYGFGIMFIPHYNTDKYPFPPFGYDMEYRGEKAFKSDRRRILGFLEGQIIFFEYNEKKGQIFKMEYELEFCDGIYKNHKLIYCLDTETYNFLIKDLRKNFLYKNPDSTAGDRRRAEVIQTKSMKYIDDKLHELKDVLPESVKRSLEME